MRVRHVRVLVSIFAAAALAACSGSDSDDENENGGGGKEVTTTLFGVVVDEARAPVSGVEVKAHGKTATTGSDGSFTFEKLKVPSERCVATAKKKGLLPASQSAVPVAGGATMLRLRLLTPEEHKISAAGGKIALKTGAKVDFAANAFKKGKEAFSGEVTVLARHIAPDQEDFAEVFPGGPAAQRVDGSSATLISAGVIAVELYAGEEVVALDGTKPARLDFPIPVGMEAALAEDATIPLWHFDEAKGLWVEEGLATREGDRYVGEVKHFSAWNLDKPEDQAFVKGKLLCSNEPMGGVSLSFSQFLGTTRVDGSFRVTIPTNYPTKLTVRDPMIPKSEWSKVIAEVPALGSQVEHDLGNILLATCPTKVIGRLVDCDGKAVEGVVHGAFESGMRSAATEKGKFTLWTPPDQPFTFNGTSGGVQIEPQELTSPATGEQPLDLGDLKACTATATCEGRDISLGALGSTSITGTDNIAFSPDGKYMAASMMLVSGSSFTAKCKLYEVATLKEVAAFDECMGFPTFFFSGDSAYLVATLAESAGNEGAMAINVATKSVAWRNHFGMHAVPTHDRMQAVSRCADEGCMEAEAVFVVYGVTDGLSKKELSLTYDDLGDGYEMLPIGTFGDELVLSGVEDRQSEEGLFLLHFLLWNIKSDTLTRKFTIEKAATANTENVTPWLSPDGSMLVVYALSVEEDGDAGTISGSFDFFDTADGAHLAGPSIWPGSVTSMVPVGGYIHPSNEWFAAPLFDMSQAATTGKLVSGISIVDLPSLSQRSLLSFPMGTFIFGSNIQFSGNGRYMAAVLMNGANLVYRIWDLEQCEGF